MRSSMFALLAITVAAQAPAAGFGLKPGLWETRVIKSVVNGQDTTAQIAGAASQMQQAMANMPPEQRARMEAMMQQNGAAAPGSNGTVKMCVTAEQANRDRPLLDRVGQGHCEPSNVTHSGAQSTFTINCTSNGAVTTGRGEVTALGDLLRSQIDMTVTRPGGEARQMHVESEMKFLGADCGDVKPPPMPKPSP